MNTIPGTIKRLFSAAQNLANETNDETFIIYDVTEDYALTVATREELETFHAHVKDDDIVAVFMPAHTPTRKDDPP